MEQKAVEIKQKLKEAEAKAGASELSTLKVQEEELKRQEEEFARKEAELIKKERVIISCESGVERFVNFEHRPWWYCGHFCQEAGKNMKKKLFPKEKIEKKGKNLGVGQTYEIKYA
jgi:hypothetical protein